MCRFVLYLGEEIGIGTLVTEPANSLIHQSFHSHEREEPLNGDGFGLAWYPRGFADRPALFKSTRPAWSDMNLHEIARVTSTSCLLAHVRAATPGLPVTELNCHPFARGPITFMHNGDLGGFAALRRQLLAGLSDEAFAAIHGTTDSEYMFAVLLDHLRATGLPVEPSTRLATALERTIATVEGLRLAVAPEEQAYLNLVACDGRAAAICRYSSEQYTDSLYWSSGRVYTCDRGLCHMDVTARPVTAVIVASEPLDEGDGWTRVEPGTMVLVSPDLQVSIRAIGAAARD